MSEDAIRHGRFARPRRAAALAVALSCALAPCAASAGVAVALKADVSSGDLVTLGDLFDGADAESKVVVGAGAPIGQDAVLDARVVQQIATRNGLDWANPDGLLRIIVPRRGAPAARMAEVLAFSHSVMAGELIQPEDLDYVKVPAFSVPGDAARNADDVIGKVARRPLPTNAPVAMHDLAAAEVIKANDTVQVIYRADGISLTLQGVALGSAAVGDAVSVMNTNSKKVVQAIASGPDEALVGPQAEQLRGGGPAVSAQFAALP